MSQELHLLQEHYTTVRVVFDDICVHSLHKPTAVNDKNHDFSYTYKIDKAIDVQVGDWVIVPARDTLKIVQVVEVHDEPQLDLNAKYQYKWVVQKVDTHAYVQRLEEEERLMSVLQRLHWVEQQQKLHQRLQNAQKEDKQLSSLLSKVKSFLK
ncbi:MAG: hypothetical protein Q4D05_03725 [Acinetobacter sp.]|nr:hypothetical protein [Acinetobacter sp.]